MLSTTDLVAASRKSAVNQSLEVAFALCASGQHAMVHEPAISGSEGMCGALTRRSYKIAGYSLIPFVTRKRLRPFLQILEEFAHLVGSAYLCKAWLPKCVNTRLECLCKNFAIKQTR